MTTGRMLPSSNGIIRHACTQLLSCAVVLTGACSNDSTDSSSVPSSAADLRQGDREPVLLARAILASDAYQPGPQSGAFNNNYPGSDGRWIARDRPDDTELILVRVPPNR